MQPQVPQDGRGGGEQHGMDEKQPDRRQQAERQRAPFDRRAKKAPDGRSGACDGR
jgi:hypothetical protein